MTTLSLSNFDTSNVTNMQGMFYYCNSLTILNLSNFDTGNVANMSDYCSSLTTLDVSNFNAATAPNAKITVNYTSDASSLVDSMIATKLSGSTVVKGIQVG